MSISHKKMKEIEDKINEILKDFSEEPSKQIINYLRDKFKYDEKVGSYNRKQYENYNKKYNEEHKETIKKQKAERYLILKQKKLNAVSSET